MKKPIYLDFQFIRFIWSLLLVFGFSTAAFGATFTVTKTADTNDGVCNTDCSLREAINVANNSTADDAIVFSSLFNSPQTITLSGNELTIAANGTLSISGSGADLLIISGDNQSRVFRVEGATATITDVKITNGKILGNGDGGGILNAGILTISQSIISNNTGASGQFSGGGGGIHNRGTMIINNSTISNNSAVSQGGGIFNDRGTGGLTAALTINNSIITSNTTNGRGAGLYNDYDCTMNVNNSTINNNLASYGGGVFSEGTANFIDVNITNNTAQNGGGIGNGGRAVMTMTTSTVNQNSAAISGGGISTSGDFGSRLTVNSSTISNNTASNNGGGIFTYRCLLTITLSSISGNVAINGGGIYNDGAFNTVTVNTSTLNSNTANKDGGGIFNTGGTFALNNSTINSNNSLSNQSEGGGGIYSITDLNVNNSTVSNNTTNNQGGGIFNRGTTNFTNSTINNNQAGSGGGIYNFDFRTVNARNTIVADNTTNSGTAPDFRGTITSQGYNLIENTTGTIISGTTTGNIFGQDPQLAPLRNNGGATQTVALQPTSPAIDAADPNNFPVTDQRGAPRPQDGDLNGTALPDIGAYERQVTAFTTTKIADTNDGVCNSDCSLREAIAAASAATTADNAIVFNPSLFNTPQIVTLSNGELSINNTNGTFFISGPGANLLSISGNNQSRVLYLGAGANAVVSGVTITSGNGIGAVNSGVGGGIYNNGGRLTVTDSVVSGNKTTNGNGGGFRNDNGGILSFSRSTIRNNNSNSDGGGIFNFGDGSIVNVSDATISNNSASSGGGIYNFSRLNLTNSTVSGNSAILFGGGVFTDGLFGATSNLNSSTISNNTAGTGGGGGNASGTVNARNNIIADNTATNSAPDFSGVLISPAYNLIENTNGTTISGTSIGNILGQNPQLLPLGNYGGATPTHALRATSPAIDKGNSFGVATDQRGRVRPFDNPAIPNATNGADIGAFERQADDAAGSTLFDFDGDGKADISVFRPDNGSWYINQSMNGFTGIAFGQSGDKIVPADYDGDGKTDVAVYRGGIWYLQRSLAGFTGIGFGTADDIPQPADFDGDGRAELAVFRPSNGTWYVLNLLTNQFSFVQFGQNGDRPVAADYDGDGRADYAVYRNGGWYILRSSQGFIGIQFGEAADRPVPTDYDGDGKADVAVFRPSNSTWYLNRSTAGFAGVQFGITMDVPAPADYDGDGKADIAVFRPSNGTWYLNRSTSGFTGVQFGATNDIPVPNAFVP